MNIRAESAAHYRPWQPAPKREKWFTSVMPFAVTRGTGQFSESGDGQDRGGRWRSQEATDIAEFAVGQSEGRKAYPERPEHRMYEQW